MNLFVRIIVKLLWSLLILIAGVVITLLVQIATQPGIIPALFLGGTVVGIIFVWIKWKKPEKKETIDKYQLNKD